MIRNFGSINIDHVYQVSSIARPGETISALSFDLVLGGKGANQSIAAARAGGAALAHHGKLGSDALWIKDLLAKDGIDVSHLSVSDCRQGHAVIQVDGRGENSIVIFGGSNHAISSGDIEDFASASSESDIVLLQNEISMIPQIMKAASETGARIFFNAAPFGSQILEYPLHLLDTLIVNETEAEGLSGASDPEKAISAIRRNFPKTAVILTMGAHGLLYSSRGEEISMKAFKAECIDSTAAGDTFIGYYAASVASGIDVRHALRRASAAAAVSVGRKGASSSIPLSSEVSDFLEKNEIPKV